MNATQKLVEEAKKVSALTTDYALAHALNWAPQKLSNYRRGVSQAGDDEAIALARLAKLPEEYALTLIASERTKSPTARLAFLKAAERLAA